MSDGLVGYWKMDEDSWDGTTNEVLDYSGNNNHGTAAADATTAAGKFGNGGTFDGTGDYVDMGDKEIFDPEDISVSVWYKTSNNSLDQGIVTKMESATDDGWDIRLVGGFLRWEFDDSSSKRAATNPPSANQWVHAVGTYDGTDLRLYVNGEEEDVDDADGYTVSGTELLVGDRNPNKDQPFNGQIDEVRIYNRALGAREVKELYQWAPGPVMHLKMDEKVAGDAQTLYDISGNENHGTTEIGGNATGMDCTKPGKYGFGCEFDGTDDYVDVGNFDFASGDFTISAWIKTSASTTASILGRSGTSFGGGDSGVRFTQFNTILNLEISDGSDYEYIESTDVVNDGQWHFVAAGRNGTDAYVYVDDSMTSESSIPSGSCDYDNIMAVGRLGHADSRYFDGLIDDVRVYNYARTQGQIIEDMNAGHPAGGSPVGSPVAYWKFNEGYGDTAYDEIGDNDGTLEASTGGSQTTESEMWELGGKFDKAVELDGTDDDVNMGDVLDFERTDTFTVSVWTKSSDNGGSVVGKMDNTDGSKGYELYFDDGHWEATIRYDTGTNGIKVLSSSDAGDNDWHHLVFTYDGSSDASGLTLYTDGEDDTGTIEDDGLTSSISNSATFNVGSRNSAVQYFDGLVDEVKVYNYEMTADQVKSEFNQGKSVVFGSSGTDSSGNPTRAASGKYCVPGDTTSCDPPVLDLNFDEMSGTTAYDLSGNGNDGTLTNGPTWNPLGKFGSSIRS